MFTDESHIISCLISRYNDKVFFKRKQSVLNFMFTENRFYWSTCYFILKGAIFFIYWWHNMTFSFWKMVLMDAFVIWYLLNELSNTSLYFFTRFLITNLFWFSILWAFRYELTNSLIINNIYVFCYNMTPMIIYKGIIIFITRAFTWIRVFKEFINIKSTNFL